MKKIKDIKIPTKKSKVLVNFRLEEEMFLQFKSKLNKDKIMMTKFFKAIVEEYLKE